MSVISAQVARHFSVQGPVEESIDKAITTRPSSSANFYVDSEDKPLGASSGNFTINKGQSLFNGFFNRLAVAEVGVDWGLPNVAEWWGNNTISITNLTTTNTFSAKLPDGFYTSIQALREVAARITTAASGAGDALELAVQYNGLDVAMVSIGAGNDPFLVNWTEGTDPPYALARQLFTKEQLSTGNTTISLSSPRVLGTTYIDIVSPQLTYNQALKDSTTDNFRFDVLYRWYFADDNVPHILEKVPYTYPAAGAAVPPWQPAPVPAAPAVTMLTETNIPILQGYTPFVHRRVLPVPKQIRWDEKQPIGQVSFQVYDDRGRLINNANFPFLNGFGGANFQFQLQLLLSEN